MDGSTFNPEQEREAKRRRNWNHGECLIMRFHALTEAGYLPETNDGCGQVYFTHPKGLPVTLWPDGELLDSSPSPETRDEDRIIIAADDRAAFNAFVARTPRLSPWSRLKRVTLGDATTQAVLIIGAIVFFNVVGRGLDWAWHAVFP